MIVVVGLAALTWAPLEPQLGCQVNDILILESDIYSCSEPQYRYSG